MASPLILRPVVDADGRAFAVALKLPGERVRKAVLEKLTLKEKDSRRESPTKGNLTPNEAADVRPLRDNGNTPDVLSSFLHFFSSL